MTAPRLEASREAPTAPDGAGACPPPLAWQDVLREFYRQADAWYVDRPRYRISGRTIGQGRPLYLLNGITGTHELYSLLVWLLRDQFRCVLFDYPTLNRGVALEEIADDLIEIADTCGDESLDLFATSFGSLVALTALHRHPRRIMRAVLQGAYAHRDLSLAERVLLRLGRFVPGYARNVPGRVAIQRQNQLRWFPPFDSTRWQFYLDNSGATPLRELACRGRILRDGDLRPYLPGIEQPVLLVRSEGEGEILAGCAEALAAGLPGANIEMMNDTGQIPYLTHPHRLAKVIRPFLESSQRRG